MVEDSIKQATMELQKGNLIILFDDMLHNAGYLMGVAENVSAPNINQMTKIAKGLTYVCMPEEKARKLELPLMVEGTNHFEATVSIDHISTTTGISVFERMQTIKELTKPDVQPDEFQKPGHIFPLVSKEKGLLERIGITEAAVDVAKMCSPIPFAYMSEMLNEAGEVATKEEIQQIVVTEKLTILYVSDLIKYTHHQIIASFRAKVTEGQKVYGKIGYPTANLIVEEDHHRLNEGVYGVKVKLHGETHLAMMSVEKSQHNHSPSYQVHIFDFDQDIYGERLEVDVCFCIREEIAFPTVNQLLFQMEKDKQMILKRFRLMEERSVVLRDSSLLEI